MSRMIDADRLIKAIRDNYDLNYGETLIDPNEFLDIVEQQPTVKKQGTTDELMPVIHSHWNEHIDYMGEKTGYWLCDSCKRLSTKYFDFCPHCGAKMDAITILEERREKTAEEMLNALQVLMEECKKHEDCGECPLSKNGERCVSNEFFGLPNE